MATDWKSPSAPVADLVHTPHSLPSSTQALAYRSLDDCTRMGRRSRATSVPFIGIATNPPTSRTRRLSESSLEPRQISTDAVRTDESGGRDLKATDGVRDGARLGAKRQRVLSESDGDSDSRTNPPPPSRQDVDEALPLKSEENGDDPSENELMPDARDDDGQAQPPQCHYEGCTKHARLSGGVFCRRHGEGRRCKTSGCNKVDVGGGSCRRHGGGRRCGAAGCLKTDVGGGFCVSHGGGKRCQVEGCTKGAQAGGLFCKSHGGGRRCRIKGCMTSAQSGADVLCIKHGGGKRCLVPGCTKLVRKNNRCTKHASQGASTTAAKVTTAVDNSTDTAGGSIEGRRPASPPSLPDNKKVMEMQGVPEVQTNRPVSVKPPSERGDVELDRAPPPPLAASITNHPSYSSPPLPSMTSITMAGKRSRLHSEAEGRPDLRLPVVRLSGRGDPLPIYPQFSFPNSSSSVNDPAVSAGDSTLEATVPVPQEPVRSSTGGMLPFEGPKARPPQEAGRAFQQPIPRLASMEPSFDLGHAVFSSGRIRNFVGSHAADSTLPPHVAADDPPFPPADNGRVEFSHKMVGSNVDRHRYSGSSRFPDGGIERSQLSTSLLPPPLPHSRHLLPPPSSVDRVAPTVPTFVAKFGSGGIGDGLSRYAYNGSVVSSVEARGGRLEVGPLNASMWSNGESSTPADPSAHSAHRPFTSTYSLPAVAAAWQRPSTPPSASSALDDSSGPGDKALTDDRLVEPRRSEDSSPLAPPQARCIKETAPSGEDEGGDAAQQRSGGVSKMSRTRSPQTPSQSQTYISLSVKGMMCMESCGQMVQRALGEVAGVRSVTVHFPTRTASVQVEPDVNVAVTDLTSALEAVGFESSCIATSTSEEPALEEAGVNAVWAIASALGLVDGGCAMAWGDQCNCGEDCKCVNCPVHMKKVSHAVDLVLKAVDLSHSTNPASPAKGDVTSSD